MQQRVIKQRNNYYNMEEALNKDAKGQHLKYKANQTMMNIEKKNIAATSII